MKTIETQAPAVTGTRRPGYWRYWLAAQRGPLVAVAIFVAMFGVYGAAQPIGLSADIINTAANKGALLALVAMAQTLPVLTGGLDLSVGMIFMLANCLASTLVTGDALTSAFGVASVLAAGLLCGLVNGLIVVYGRLQPLIATLATSAIYFGIALALRPQPGGDINGDLAELMTRSTYGIPSSALLVFAAVVCVWLPYRRSTLGRAAYAVGSSEQAAYMSGVSIARAKLGAYTLAGFFAALGGLLLTCITFSGEARAALGGDYTLNSIAALVIGGTSLFGGAGGAVGSIFGAFVMRTVGDLLIVFNINPVLQPLFVGLVLLFAVSLGSLRLLRVRNKLDLYR
ncbi:ABC transporter permease [Trinickia caryophylli]|uniref:Autoinducer 2 import system permease protein LsrC n=1 Tax=Trinickia caryophylli TaxID=28094 RepID=A0A1X7DE02_TRICW|nr:ABC transporter permease [Trinickia caryophylli]PMS09763.1 ABC transporter permease [Trinickia caryophylli]TRX16824.1 ABC transporter permease [Trinickia caryophylli]WQE12450.1 ABC transporter permease [Trinickia caryophylli]SMF13197.1 monosaccharide ABC transporter membrane protein, CUT2 family [Trinickia caryophylli]GLU31402.1 sugar ABC transporter permease [Trinickia caryophylli]